MYAYLKGIVTEKHLSHLVLEVGSIGYKIFVPPQVFNVDLNQTIKLHVSFILRENAQALYGFLEAMSRDVFDILMTLSGIGPKTALCVLGKFDPMQLKQAIDNHDTDLISTVPGIGRKTAQKMMLDLRDRLQRLHWETQTPVDPQYHKVKDAIQALMNLGFSQIQSKRAVDLVVEKNAHLELSEIITQALRFA